MVIYIRGKASELGKNRSKQMVLVGGHKCVYIVKTVDIEDQDKNANKQERSNENPNVNKVS